VYRPSKEAIKYVRTELRVQGIDSAVFEEFIAIMVSDRRVHPKGIIQNLEL